MKWLEDRLYQIGLWGTKIYNQVLRRLFWMEFDKRHLVLRREGGMFQLVIYKHRDYAREIQQRITDYEYREYQEHYIWYAMTEALNGCVFIQIRKGDKMIHFWTMRGKLQLEVNIDRPGKNKKLFYEVMGILSTLGFVDESSGYTDTSTVWGHKRTYTYKIEDYSNMIIIKAEFVKDKGKACDFVTRMFDHVYRRKNWDVRIQVG
jgi:hypothetical protein